MNLFDKLRQVFGSPYVVSGDTGSPPPPPVKQVSSDSSDGSDFEITEEYLEIKKGIEAGIPLIFVTGKAGTGKSTLITYLKAILDKNVVVVAPTGVAALNVKGATIHSFFQLPPRILVEDDIKQARDRRLYRGIDLLIIDEISMVRADVFDAIDQFLRLNGRFRNRPFGGVQLLVIGDLYQLAPVVSSRERPLLEERGYKTGYFFGAKVLEFCKPKVFELSLIFRQKDPSFTEMLNRIRIADSVHAIVANLNGKCSDKQEAKSVITLTCRNHSADSINATKLAQLPLKAHCYEGHASGKFNIDDEKLPSPQNLCLKVGAQVMFTKNDEQKRWVNGTLGIVNALEDELIQVQLLTGMRPTYDVQRAKWETFKYEYDSFEEKIKPVVSGRYIQFPVMLAWAVTIHKSQGQTLDKVRIDLDAGAFAPGQVYVALSRCRSIDGISLARPIDPTEIICDDAVKRYYEQVLGKEDLQVPVDTQNTCPYCSGKLRERTGKNGAFLGCSNYPRCKFTKDLPPPDFPII